MTGPKKPLQSSLISTCHQHIYHDIPITAAILNYSGRNVACHCVFIIYRVGTGLINIRFMPLRHVRHSLPHKQHNAGGEFVLMARGLLPPPQYTMSAISADHGRHFGSNSPTGHQGRQWRPPVAHVHTKFLATP